MPIDIYPLIRINAVVPNELVKKLKPIPAKDDTLLDDDATAEAILSARNSAQVSQKTLSMEMGISQSYLCDLEKGVRRWSLALFEQAKAALERLTK